LSKETSFLVYCEQMSDDMCANGLQAVAGRWIYRGFAAPKNFVAIKAKVA
jgi:hypothetical protein